MIKPEDWSRLEIAFRLMKPVPFSMFDTHGRSQNSSGVTTANTDGLFTATVEALRGRWTREGQPDPITLAIQPMDRWERQLTRAANTALYDIEPEEDDDNDHFEDDHDEDEDNN